MKKIVSLAVLTAMLAGCADLSTTGKGATVSDGFGEETLVMAGGTTVNDSSLLAPAPKYYIGTAYKVDDVQYIPVEDLTYNQTGLAGIIPTELNGTKTSNGEIFDVNQMVATSKTLPLPTIVACGCQKNWSEWSGQDSGPGFGRSDNCCQDSNNGGSCAGRCV